MGKLKVQLTDWTSKMVSWRLRKWKCLSICRVQMVIFLDRESKYCISEVSNDKERLYNITLFFSSLSLFNCTVNTFIIITSSYSSILPLSLTTTDKLSNGLKDDHIQYSVWKVWMIYMSLLYTRHDIVKKKH